VHVSPHISSLVVAWNSRSAVDLVCKCQPLPPPIAARIFNPSKIRFEELISVSQIRILTAASAEKEKGGRVGGRCSRMGDR
jgi:hypothetical protein